MRLGDWALALVYLEQLFLDCSSFLFVAVSYFLQKPEKTERSLFYNTCLYLESLIYGTFRGKKMVPVAEKLLRHGTFRGKNLK